MRKITLILCAVLMTAVSATASNYFTLRTEATTEANDTLRILPTLSGTYCRTYVTAHFDGYLDSWFLQMSHPSSLDIMQLEWGTALNVPYTMRNGTDSVFHAVLTTHYMNQSSNDNPNIAKSYFSSTINTLGYWDPDSDNVYETYGTVKWGSGNHDFMFRFFMMIPSGCTEETITLDCTLSSGPDWRGYGTINGHFIKTIHLIVAYLRGDANGDGWVNIDDVSTLTNYLLGLQNLDQYQLAAADVDGDGVVTVDDVTALIDLLMLS